MEKSRPWLILHIKDRRHERKETQEVQLICADWVLYWALYWALYFVSNRVVYTTFKVFCMFEYVKRQHIWRYNDIFIFSWELGQELRRYIKDNNIVSVTRKQTFKKHILRNNYWRVIKEKIAQKHREYCFWILFHYEHELVPKIRFLVVFVSIVLCLVCYQNQ